MGARQRTASAGRGAPPRARLAGIGGALESALAAFAGLAMLVGAPLALVASITWDQRLSDVTPIPWFGVLMLGAVAVSLVWGTITAVRVAAEEQRWPGLGVLTVVGLMVLATPCFTVLAIGTLLIQVAIGGQPVVGGPQAEVLAAQDVYRQLAWDSIDVIPVIDVPEAMGWARPVADPAWPLGLGAVTMRVVTVLIVIWAVRELVVLHSHRRQALAE